jgi:hypothetical protein
MKNYRNNFRRNRYKSNIDRNHQKNGNGTGLINDLQNGSNFQRKNYGRNNHNASKLVEKYNSLAREALANEDKILSESYFQYADHFTRVLSEREKNQSIKEINNPGKNRVHASSDEKNKTDLEINKEVEKKSASS